MIDVWLLLNTNIRSWSPCHNSQIIQLFQFVCREMLKSASKDIRSYTLTKPMTSQWFKPHAHLKSS